MAATLAFGSVGSALRFKLSMASSKSAWTKPIGCVQGRPVADIQSFATAPADKPFNEDLKGCVGLHQTSHERLFPDLPSASSATGKRMALPMEATLGLKPFWFA